MKPRAGVPLKRDKAHLQGCPFSRYPWFRQFVFKQGVWMFVWWTEGRFFTKNALFQMQLCSVLTLQISGKQCAFNSSLSILPQRSC